MNKEPTMKSIKYKTLYKWFSAAIAVTILAAAVPTVATGACLYFADLVYAVTGKAE
jgi:hypothetical protein